MKAIAVKDAENKFGKMLDIAQRERAMIKRGV